MLVFSLCRNKDASVVSSSYFGWLLIFHVVFLLLCFFMSLILFELIAVCSLENLVFIGSLKLFSNFCSFNS